MTDALEIAPEDIMANQFGETNAVALGIGAETTYATFPSGNLAALRYTGESFGQQQNATVSGEIRTDGQVPDLIRTGVSAQGGYNGEISYGVLSWENALRSLLGAAAVFGTPPARETGAIQAIASSNSLVSDSTGAGPSFTDLAQGDWIRTTGFTAAANNGYAQIASKNTSVNTAHTIVLRWLTLADEAAAAGRGVQGSAVVRNGTTCTSFSVEKQWTDLNSGNGFAARILGYLFGSCQLNLTPEAIATFAFTGQGRNVTDTTGVDFSDASAAVDFATLATLTAAATNDVMNTVDGITDGQIIVNRAAPFSGITFQSLQVTPTRALRRQSGLNASLGGAGVGWGRLSIPGSATAYFQDVQLLTAHLRYTETDLAVVIKDGANNAYLVDLPAIKFGGDGIPKAGGLDQGAVINLDIGAKLTQGNLASGSYMIGVHKFVAPS